MKTTSLSEKQTNDVQKSCICLHLHRAARSVTRQFDQVFRPLGITSGQYSLLMSLVRRKPPSIGQLAEDMAMDRTTITANIKPLKRQGLLEAVADPSDARSRLLVLTSQGKKLLGEAFPLWEEAQSKILESLSVQDKEQFLDVLREVADR